MAPNGKRPGRGDPGGPIDGDLQQLKQLLPSLNTQRNASQVEIMQEAAKYIDHLQSNLICHIRTHGYPDRLKSFAAKSSYQDKDGIQTTLNSYLVGQGRRK
ncbi:hypothetical protein TCAL_00592 [Tigriopus californicus]|uniref:BHLH domain-containing protein n=1 Tax=Tigriopus californicus TaxID=6832 RepID=A0A553PA93_TIGCA|nr:uncharacterized protein LOC131892968 [Tigriopus californicus]TRY74600.1 hypothetical protein TCAL_00592 [Tigriopus californicus]|eukprot:TCALIF_00592-PA protein Name:"Protein of unknown function" AED:0.00 eAED:0.00 QI:160/1/1/1/1/1/2/266/100